MNEIIFIVEESLEGGYTAKALETSIYTQADSIEQLRKTVVDAVRCHFKTKKISLSDYRLMEKK